MRDPEHSVERGTIGAPTFFVGDEVFSARIACESLKKQF
jgi:2-hydroxychromene-2-carboxylate isomerase